MSVIGEGGESQRCLRGSERVWPWMKQMRQRMQLLHDGDLVGNSCLFILP